LNFGNKESCATLLFNFKTMKKLSLKDLELELLAIALPGTKVNVLYYSSILDKREIIYLN